MGDTRAHILSVARGVFSRQGLDGTTVRQIARAAEVDPALILHYFDSKEALFFESVRESLFPLIEMILGRAEERTPIGNAIVDAFLGLWDSPDHRPALLALVRAGASNERIGAQFRDFFGMAIPSRLGPRVPRETAALRVGLVASQLVGLAIARYLVRIDAVANARRSDLVAAIGPTLTRYVTGPLPGFRAAPRAATSLK